MVKKIEQPVVDKVRNLLHDSFGYPMPSTVPDSQGLLVYEQDSYKTNSLLNQLLLHSSKCTRATSDKLWTLQADYGKPEFIIINYNQNLAIVIECKNNIAKKHSGKRLRDENILERNANLISSNACEGALHYAKFLSEDYDVIALGITGDVAPDSTVVNIQITTYAWERGRKYEDSRPGPFINMELDKLMSYSDYLKAFEKIDIKKKKMAETSASIIARDLNETLHNASVPPIERSLLISGLLLVLKDPVFINSYKDKKVTSKQLLRLLGTSIGETLDNLGVVDTFKKEMLKTKFKDVFNQQGLLKDNANILRGVLKTLDNSVSPYMSGEYSIDIVGKFYSEFLRYAKGDKSSGIVLTPSHITELFCDLVDLNIDDSVLDPCSGTAGFLISAMNRLYSMASKLPNVEDLWQEIKDSRLFGCDDDKQMFALGCSNMILRGDGKANMQYGSCFDHRSELELKATVGMINPPYSGTNISCLEFLEFLCECIRHKDDKGTLVGKTRSRGDNLVCAIIPTSYMNSDEWKGQRKRLLERNTLVATMSMPIDLFRPISIVTCIVLLKPGIPHDPEVPTYLGNWKDDGYIWKKGLGRIPDGDRPHEVKELWLKTLKRTVEDKNIGIWKCLDGEDECCWEKYAETDYSTITQELFEAEVKHFMIYKLKESSILDEDIIEDDSEGESL